MGLVVSIAIVCVGVLEALSAARHIQDGYLPFWITRHAHVITRDDSSSSSDEDEVSRIMVDELVSTTTERAYGLTPTLVEHRRRTPTPTSDKYVVTTPSVECGMITERFRPISPTECGVVSEAFNGECLYPDSLETTPVHDVTPVDLSLEASVTTPSASSLGAPSQVDRTNESSTHSENTLQEVFTSDIQTRSVSLLHRPLPVIETTTEIPPRPLPDDTTEFAPSSLPDEITTEIPPSSLPDEITTEIPPSSLPDEITTEIPPSSLPDEITTEIPPSSLPDEITTEFPPCSLPDEITTETPPCSLPDDTTEIPPSSLPYKITTEIPPCSLPDDTTEIPPSSLPDEITTEISPCSLPDDTTEIPPSSLPDEITTEIPPCSLPDDTTEIPPSSLPDEITTEIPPCSLPDDTTEIPPSSLPDEITTEIRPSSLPDEITTLNDSHIRSKPSQLDFDPKLSSRHSSEDSELTSYHNMEPFDLITLSSSRPNTPRKAVDISWPVFHPDAPVIKRPAVVTDYIRRSLSRDDSIDEDLDLDEDLRIVEESDLVALKIVEDTDLEPSLQVVEEMDEVLLKIVEDTDTDSREPSLQVVEKIDEVLLKIVEDTDEIPLIVDEDIDVQLKIVEDTDEIPLERDEAVGQTPLKIVEDVFSIPLKILEDKDQTLLEIKDTFDAVPSDLDLISVENTSKPVAPPLDHDHPSYPKIRATDTQIDIVEDHFSKIVVDPLSTPVAVSTPFIEVRAGSTFTTPRSGDPPPQEPCKIAVDSYGKILPASVEETIVKTVDQDVEETIVKTVHRDVERQVSLKEILEPECKKSFVQDSAIPVDLTSVLKDEPTAETSDLEGSGLEISEESPVPVDLTSVLKDEPTVALVQSDVEGLNGDEESSDSISYGKDITLKESSIKRRKSYRDKKRSTSGRTSTENIPEEIVDQEAKAKLREDIREWAKMDDVFSDDTRQDARTKEEDIRQDARTKEEDTRQDARTKEEDIRQDARTKEEDIRQDSRTKEEDIRQDARTKEEDIRQDGGNKKAVEDSKVDIEEVAVAPDEIVHRRESATEAILNKELLPVEDSKVDIEEVAAAPDEIVHRRESATEAILNKELLPVEVLHSGETSVVYATTSNQDRRRLKKPARAESFEEASKEPPRVEATSSTKSNESNNEDDSISESSSSIKQPVQASNPAFWLIFSGEYTKAMSKDWHSGHFCCWQCDESLTGQRYVLRDDHPYCIKCYESVFANMCEECNKTIGIDSKDLSYKDKHWHEACFLCNKCRVSLVDKQFGSKADKIYCGNCYDSQFASRCDGCGEIFRAGTKKMEYKTRQWHEKCFCCCVCKSAIGTKSFIPREQEIYCATCYEEKFATRCVKCNKIITSGGVTYKNEPWHRECFTCTHCNTSLAGQRFTSRDEKPYCAECFGELFAKRCTACVKPITGIGGTRFISFEDRHWHNDCFICASCKTSLVGRGFITDADDIICPECAKQKLM